MKELTKNKTALVIFLMVTVAILANTLLTLYNLRRVEFHSRQVSHTNEVLLEIKSVLIALTDVQTSARGYAITGDTSYLVPYNTAKITKLSDRVLLRNLMSDNPTQLERLDLLEKDIDSFLANADKSITLRSTEGKEAAFQHIASGKGQDLMGRIRQLSEELQEEERRLLRSRSAEALFSYQTTHFTVLTTSGLGLAMVALGSFLVNRDIARKEAFSQTLQATLDDLENRVRQRTQEISAANNQLVEEIAERRKAEEQAILLTEELRRSNRELEQFASVASHDLQEPLRKIQAFGDRLYGKFHGELGDVGADYLDRILASAGRMRSLIDDLLAYSRVTNKARPFVPVDLQQTVKEVISDLDGRLQQTGGEIKLNPLPTIDADPLQMRQLFQNLLGNALKFRQPDTLPFVQVFCRQLPEPNPHDSSPTQPTHLEIVVQDNGIGFEQIYADRIFEVFQRLHGRDEYDGTGMGLAICRKIVDRHGGSITAESAPNHGARFIILLPITQNSSKQDTP